LALISSKREHKNRAMPEAVREWVVAFGQWLYDRSGGWAVEQPVEKTLYKYCSAERVHVLQDCSVRFSQRTVFEGERELRPEVAAFGTEEEMRAYLAFNPSTMGCAGIALSPTDLRLAQGSAVGRQNVVPYITRISSYFAEVLRFRIAG
jgi:hypothetical protein